MQLVSLLGEFANSLQESTNLVDKSIKLLLSKKTTPMQKKLVKTQLKVHERHAKAKREKLLGSINEMTHRMAPQYLEEYHMLQQLKSYLEKKKETSTNNNNIDADLHSVNKEIQRVLECNLWLILLQQCKSDIRTPTKKLGSSLSSLSTNTLQSPPNTELKPVVLVNDVPSPMSILSHEEENSSIDSRNKMQTSPLNTTNAVINASTTLGDLDKAKGIVDLEAKEVNQQINGYNNESLSANNKDIFHINYTNSSMVDVLDERGPSINLKDELILSSLQGHPSSISNANNEISHHNYANDNLSDVEESAKSKQRYYDSDVLDQICINADSYLQTHEKRCNEQNEELNNSNFESTQGKETSNLDNSSQMLEENSPFNYIEHSHSIEKSSQLTVPIPQSNRILQNIITPAKDLHESCLNMSSQMCDIEYNSELQETPQKSLTNRVFQVEDSQVEDSLIEEDTALKKEEYQNYFTNTKNNAQRKFNNNVHVTNFDIIMDIHKDTVYKKDLNHKKPKEMTSISGYKICQTNGVTITSGGRHSNPQPNLSTTHLRLNHDLIM